MTDRIDVLSGERPADIPFGPQSIAEMIANYADPAAVAVVGLDRIYTYSQLDEAVDAAAAALLDLGLKAGDRVAASAPNDADIIIAFLATQRLGLVWVGINRNLAPAEKAFQIRDTEAAILLAPTEILDEICHLVPEQTRLSSFDADVPSGWRERVTSRLGVHPPRPDIDPFALAAIAYTSGTTGTPKGACHTQHSMMTFPAAGFYALRDSFWQPNLRRSVTIALTILNGMVFGPVPALASGGTYICMERNDSTSVAQTIARHSVECLATVSTVVYDLMFKPELQSLDLSSLKAVSAGGSPVTDKIKASFAARFGLALQENYGMTEAPCAIARSAVATSVPGAVGEAYPHITIAALDEHGNAMPAGEIGELALRAVDSGPWANVFSGMTGYWRRPDESNDTLRGGWLHTGDLGQIDPDGVVKIVGRQKDIILRGGANVYPVEIERILQTDERIESAAVVGLADDRLGEIVAAYLRLADPGIPLTGLRAELEQMCQALIARYKVPQRWFVVSEMPRNAMQKVNKAMLRQSEAQSLELTE